jgi:hypothetical protein
VGHLFWTVLLEQHALQFQRLLTNHHQSQRQRMVDDPGVSHPALLSFEELSMTVNQSLTTPSDKL